MSLIKANAVQIGQSGIATDNFTLAVPSSPDGTIKLARGNSGVTTQDVMNVSDTGVVSFPQGFSTSNIIADVTGNLIGDVYASNGTYKVLDNGTNGTDATFTGSVSGGTLSGNASSAMVLATDSITSRSLAKRFSDSVNVLDFGAYNDGTNGPATTAAITAAVNTGKNVYFPTGKYTVTSTITISTRGQGLFGDGGSIGGKADIPTNNYGSIIQLANTDLATPIFLITESQVTFNCLKFRGDAGNTSDIGLLFQKITNTDDMDGYVYDCEFYQLFNPIYFYGRALHADKNVFSANITTAITLDWPSSGTTGGSLQNSDEYKGRAQRITNNRFHGVTRSILVKNYIQRSPIYSNNSVDIGDSLIRFEENAGVYGGIINSNVIDICTQIPIDFKTGTKCVDTVISNNKIGGGIGLIDGVTERPNTAIRFDGLSELKNVLITGNTISAVNGNAIQIINDSSAPNIEIKNIVITNNLIDSVGLDGAANRTIVNSVYDINGFIFTNNAISNLGAFGIISGTASPKTITGNGYVVAVGNTIIVSDGNNKVTGTVTVATPTQITFTYSGTLNNGDGTFTNGSSIIRSLSKNFTNVIVKNNIWNYSTIPLFSTTTLGTPNEIDHKMGGYGISTGGFFILGEQGAYNGSLPLVLKRTSSSGGVGIRFENIDGSIDIFADPTAAGTGVFVPGTDNLVDLGTASNSWRNLYYDGAVNPSDDRLKTYLSIEESEKSAAIEIKSNIRKFKFNSAIEKKGDGARIHWGVSAQQVAEIMKSHGLDPAKYSFWCYDEWDEQPEEIDSEGNVIREKVLAGNKYGIKYTELLAFIISAI